MLAHGSDSYSVQVYTLYDFNLRSTDYGLPALQGSAYRENDHMPKMQIRYNHHRWWPCSQSLDGRQIYYKK